MPGNSEVDFRKQKVDAKKHYGERQVDKWCLWSFNNLGVIKWNSLMYQQKLYNLYQNGSKNE